MDHINDILAGNLKRLREERKFSLDALSKITGVSKSMLGQIERGEVSPTITTVWKIAGGLKVPFTELMVVPSVDLEIVDSKDLEPLSEDEGKFRNYPVFPFDSKRRFEMYYIEIDPGSEMQAEAHSAGSEEFVTVFSGKLLLRISDQNISAASGTSIRFRCDRPHFYKNESDELCKLSMVIYYPQE